MIALPLNPSLARWRDLAGDRIEDVAYGNAWGCSQRQDYGDICS
jgi:hypothetical protein